jgi:uncharacterized Fe-S cluster-containing protein
MIENIENIRGAVGQARKMSVTEALETEKQQLEARLAEVNETLKIVREHPEIQKVIDAVSKHTRF